MIADTLFRAPLFHKKSFRRTDTLSEFKSITLDNFRISKVTQKNMQGQTAMDPALQKLSILVMTSFATAKAGVDLLLQPYHTSKINSQWQMAKCIKVGQIRLATALSPNAKLNMSHQPSDKTQYSDPCEDAPPSGPPLPIVNAPITLLQKQLPSSQQLGTRPRQTHCPVPDIQNRYTEVPYDHKRGHLTCAEHISLH